MVLPAPCSAQQPEYPRAGLQIHPGYRQVPAEPPGHAGDLDVHVVPFGVRVAYQAIAVQAAAHAR